MVKLRFDASMPLYKFQPIRHTNALFFSHFFSFFSNKTLGKLGVLEFSVVIRWVRIAKVKEFGEIAISVM